MSKVTKVVHVPKTVLTARNRPADTYKTVRVNLPPKKGNR